MSLYEKLVVIYPELLEKTGLFWVYTITLVNPPDGPEFISTWNWDKPQPTQEQLDAITG